jgi:hypothetical protein
VGRGKGFVYDLYTLKSTLKALQNWEI